MHHDSLHITNGFKINDLEVYSSKSIAQRNYPSDLGYTMFVPLKLFSLFHNSLFPVTSTAENMDPFTLLFLIAYSGYSQFRLSLKLASFEFSK